MKKIFALALILGAVLAQASHIVGGEFRMHYLSGLQYRFNLVIYFDLINGNAGSKDLTVTAKIFRNSDNSFIREVTMPLTSETELNYGQLTCSVGSMRTKELVYTADIILQPDMYNDPGGYYIVWERCCRNYTLSNIVSNDPNVSAAAGQTFLLEFPAIMPAGELFINSSPQFFKPLVDYACNGRPYFVDFSAQDADGDSLVYSVVPPLSTHTFQALPVIGPKPYPWVTWRAGFSQENMLGGNSRLAINAKGLITVVPSLDGLFAYAVQCDEYRNGVKIGSVRREYQLLTITCPIENAPELQTKSINGNYSSTPLTVHLDYNAIDASRCIQVRVTDPDVNTNSQPIRINAIPIGFSGDMSSILPDVTTATLSTSTPSAEFFICFDRCPPVDNNTFQVAIVGYDASCTVALTDTAYVNVIIDNVPEGSCKLQTILFPSIPNKIFGTPPFALDASASSELPIAYTSSNDSRASIALSEITLHQPGYVQITAIQGGNENYQAADPIMRSFCINPLAPELSFITENGNTVIQSSSADGNLWFRNGEFQASLGGRSIPLEGGSENFTITAKVIVNQCISEESNSLIITGLEKSFMHVYPNPVSEELQVIVGNVFDDVQLELMDVRGRSIFSGTMHSGAFRFDMNDLPSGIYLLGVRTGMSMRVQRILKK